MTSHVKLSYVYKLVVYAERGLRELKPLVKPLVALLRTPSLFDRVFGWVYAKVMNGVLLLPPYPERIYRASAKKLLGAEEVAELEVARGRGLLQFMVESFAKVEILTSWRALTLSELLRLLQGSLSRSILVSSLLSGVLLTIALLFLVLRSLGWP